MTPVGGKKRKSWRLKKKYNKWFMELVQSFVTITLKEMPNELFMDTLSTQDYEIMRLYK